jgi:hypothetical protein
VNLELSLFHGSRGAVGRHLPGLWRLRLRIGVVLAISHLLTCQRELVQLNLALRRLMLHLTKVRD